MRAVLVVFTFALALLLYIDRVCISVAKSDITKDLGISDEAMGWVFAIFAFGYALGQLPAGTVIDKFGVRKVLTGIVAIWSLFTAIVITSYSIHYTKLYDRQVRAFYGINFTSSRIS